eukprot:11197876-Lingulodinium_polyedra.AAC.1
MVRATRAICKPLRRRIVDSNAFLCSVQTTLHKNALEPAVRNHGGLRIARARTPREQLFA